MRLTLADKFDFPHPLSRNISFINMFSVYEVLKQPAIAQEFVYYSDGFLLQLFVLLFYGKRIHRVSFDYSSIADSVFKDCEQHNRRIFFVGARPNELTAFLEKISDRYPSLSVVGSSHGHVPRSEWEPLCAEIRALQPDLLIVGMGGGLQERFIYHARRAGYRGQALTCGGFISQTASSPSCAYYPDLINRMHLRFLYRMFREPHTIKRYLLAYPRNLVSLAHDCAKRSLELTVADNDACKAVTLPGITPQAPLSPTTPVDEHRVRSSKRG
jgi:N-acetylglucosaminyldiphosphoundecaprenol N-acetyl-beta-D-mannosaminyltransferase